MLNSIRGNAPSFNVSGVYPTTPEKSKVEPAALRDGGHIAFSYIPSKNKKSNTLSLFFGPPSDPDNDEKYMKDFFSQPGLHAVCGGTTAAIAARCLNAELKPSLDYYDDDIPPTAEIDGIDLVCEGVITVNAVISQIKNFIAKHESFADKSNSSRINRRSCGENQTGSDAVHPEYTADYSDFPDYSDSPDYSDYSDYVDPRLDGASRLFDLLVYRANNINLYIGNAKNPAHQTEDFPFPIEKKLKLGNTLTVLLKKIGKNVTVKYCR